MNCPKLAPSLKWLLGLRGKAEMVAGQGADLGDL